MTDQQIPADDLRRFIARCRTAVNDRGSILLDELEALLPDPPRPTLADMTQEERAACLRMQCDTAPNRSVRGFIAAIHTGGCYVVERDTWEWRSCSDDLVTPRPDLPRMEWPGDQEVAPALPDGFRLAEHPDYGRVIVTTPDPGCDGDVYFVYPETVLSLGFNSGWCDPDELTYIDGPTTKGAGTTTGPNDVAVGTVIESADDPRIADLPLGSILLDRNEEATTKRHWGWSGAGFSPIVYERDRFAPWTVLHIPKEADQ